MTAYRITNQTSGADLGLYEGDSELAAYQAMFRDACADVESAIPEDISIVEVAETTKTPREHGFEDGETVARELDADLRRDPDHTEEVIRAEVEKLCEGCADGALIDALGADKICELFGLGEYTEEVWDSAACEKALADYNEGFREGVRSTLEDDTTPANVYSLNLVHCDEHGECDGSGEVLSEHATREEAHEAGRSYRREHPLAWLQVVSEPSGQGEDVEPA